MRASVILYGAKQLPAKCCLFVIQNPWEHTLVRCSSEVNKFHSWNWIWKWCQFCLGLNMFLWNWLHCKQLTLKQAFASIMGIICHEYYMFDIIYVFHFRTMYSIDIIFIHIVCQKRKKIQPHLPVHANVTVETSSYACLRQCLLASNIKWATYIVSYINSRSKVIKLYTIRSVLWPCHS